MAVAQDGLTKAPAPITCELCIIGAGIAGLNALFASSRYLGKHDKVILVDQKPEVGGMWTQTYDYVRLHQPYPMFTAGNIPWTPDKPRSHLATKQEVLHHFQHCLGILRQRGDSVPPQHAADYASGPDQGDAGLRAGLQSLVPVAQADTGYASPDSQPSAVFEPLPSSARSAA